MSQLFASFFRPTRGMYDSQKRIETASNNIANANTIGYSRQRVDNVSGKFHNNDIIGKIENDTDYLKVGRARDFFLDNQIRSENGILGEFKSKAETLGQVEISFLEPSENGLNKVMSEMWNSWQELSKNSSEDSVKSVVSQKTEDFVFTLNSLASRLENLKKDSKDLMGNNVLELNKKLEQIDNLNQQIYKSTITNVEPNDLLDQRDLLLDDISKSMKVEVTLDKFNRANITAGDIELVSSDPKKEIGSEVSFVHSVEEVEGGYQINISLGGDGVNKSKSFVISKEEYDSDFSYLKEGNIVYTDKDMINNETLVKEDISQFEDKLVTGEIKGYKESFELIEKYSSNIDNLANSIAQRINIIHKDDGVDLEGGIDFFTGADADGKFTAKNIKLNKEISDNPTLINSNKISDNDKNDGSRALAISNLRNISFSVDDSTKNEILSDYDRDNIQFSESGEGTSFDGYYNDLISNIGIDKQGVDRMVSNEEALLQQLNGRKESISGVSIDEEIASIVQFQNVYAANAKVMATLTEMLDVLINRTGV